MVTDLVHVEVTVSYLGRSTEPTAVDCQCVLGVVVTLAGKNEPYFPYQIRINTTSWPGFTCSEGTTKAPNKFFPQSPNRIIANGVS